MKRTATNRRRLFKRLLSSLLFLSLVLGMVALGGNPRPELSQVEVETANLLNVAAVMGGSAPKFRVPELIYLNPGNKTQMRYYYGVDDAGVATPKAHTNAIDNGEVKAIFAPGNVPSGVTVKVAALTNPYEWSSVTTTGTYRIGSMTIGGVARATAADAYNTGWALTASGGNFTGALTAGSLAAALPNNGIAVLRWTFEYTLPTGGACKSYAYSLVFQTRTGNETVNGSAASGNSGPYISVWAAGTHTNGNSAISGDTTNRRLGYFKSDPLSVSARFTQAADPVLERPSTGKVWLADRSEINAANTQNASVVISHPTAAEQRFSTYYRARGGNNSTNTIQVHNNSAANTIDGGEGRLTVDISRFSNANQIPTLMVGIDMHYESDGSARDAKYVEYLPHWQTSAGYKSAGADVHPGHTTAGAWWGANVTTGGDPNSGGTGYNNTNTAGNTVAAARRVATQTATTVNAGDAGLMGHRWYVPIDGDLTSSTVNNTLSVQAKSAGDKGNARQAIFVSTYVTFNKVDKAAMRATYYDGLDYFYPDTGDGGGKFQDYQNALLERLVKLANPTDASVITTPLAKPSSTATAEHLNQTWPTLNRGSGAGKVGADETAAYYYGETVSANYSTFPGYSPAGSYTVTGADNTAVNYASNPYAATDLRAYLKTVPSYFNFYAWGASLTGMYNGTRTWNAAGGTMTLQHNNGSDPYTNPNGDANTSYTVKLGTGKTYRFFALMYVTNNAGTVTPGIIPPISNSILFQHPSQAAAYNNATITLASAPVDLGGGWWMINMQFTTTADWTSVRMGCLNANGFTNNHRLVITDMLITDAADDVYTNWASYVSGYTQPGSVGAPGTASLKSDGKNRVSAPDYTIYSADYADIKFTFNYTANDYEVAFDANQPGTASTAMTGGPMANQSFTYDDPGRENLTENDFELPGYTFTGWNTQANGGGTAYADEALVNIATANNATVTLYAQWQPRTFDVEFDLDGGEIGGDPSSVTIQQTFDAPYSLPLTKPENGDAEFLGWWTGPNGTGVEITAATLANGGYLALGVSPAATLYAYWEGDTYTVHFDYNGGDVNGDPGPYIRTGGEEATLVLPTTDPKRLGYTFVGWFIDPDDPFGTALTSPLTFEDVLSQDSIDDPDVPTDIYAKWAPVSYNIIWVLEGGTYNGGTTPPTSTVQYDDQYIVPTPDPEKTGYNFGGWWTKPDGGVPITNAVDVTDATLSYLSILFPGTSATVFYARWLYDGQYSIVYDLQGGIMLGATATSFMVYETETFGPTNMPDADPLRTGYEFKGWWTKPGGPSGGGVEIEAGDAITDTLDTGSSASVTTYYAYWEPVEYTVIFDAQGGAPTGDDFTVTFEDTYTLPTQPMRDGYTFAGWWTNDDGTGTQITGATPVSNLTLSGDSLDDPDEPTTFYAKWTAIQYTLRYDSDGADGGGAVPGGQLVAYEYTTVPAAPVITKTGYDFVRWDVIINGDAVGTLAEGGAPGNTMSKTAGQVVILKAIWAPKTNTAYEVWVYQADAGGVYGTPDIVGKTGTTGATVVIDLTDYDDPLYTLDAAAANVLGGVIAASGGLVLKLYYKRALVKLTVDPNGGTGGGLVGSFPWGSAQTLAQPAAPAGMAFKEWKITWGTTEYTQPGNAVTLGEADTVATAIWQNSGADFKVEIYTQNAAGTYDLSQTINETGTGAVSGASHTIDKATYYDDSYIPTASYRNVAVSGSDELTIDPIAAGGGSTFKLYFPRAFVTLTIDTDGADIDSAPGDGTYAGLYYWGQQVALTNPEKIGHTFGGWAVTGSGAGFIDGKLVIGTTATTITANWVAPASSAAKYMVEVYLQQADGLYGGAASASFLKVGPLGPGAATAAGTEWSDSNYTFDGAAANVLSADLTGDYATSQQLKLYYKRNPVTLTVDLDGGTAGGIAGGTTSRVWGEEITLGADPAKPGYTFSHWTVDSGAGASIVSGVLALGTTNTAITAHWIPEPAVSEVIYAVEIYLMEADGSYGAAAQSVKKSATPGAGAATAEPTDWSGAGYTYDSGAGSADLAADGTATPQLELYYKRTLAGFTVNDGGSGSQTDPGTYMWGHVITLDPAPTKAGYVFVGWALTGGTGSLAGNLLTLGENTVVQANWIPVSVATASYKVNIFLQKADGTYAGADTFVTKSGVVGAGNASAAAGDWSGAGYAYDSGAGSADLGAGGITNPVLNLYYKRTLVNLTVDLGGGTGGTASQTGLRWGSEVALSDPTREGYTFSHWRVTAGAGAGITEGNKLILGTADTAIEAVWTDNSAGGGGPIKIGCLTIPNWLLPFLHVGTFLLGFGAGWLTRVVTMPWWLIVLLVILGICLFPLFWWIIL